MTEILEQISQLSLSLEKQDAAIMKYERLRRMPASETEGK